LLPSVPSQALVCLQLEDPLTDDLETDPTVVLAINFLLLMVSILALSQAVRMYIHAVCPYHHVGPCHSLESTSFFHCFHSLFIACVEAFGWQQIINSWM
jgi:hypothetical protein